LIGPRKLSDEADVFVHDKEKTISFETMRLTTIKDRSLAK
jgi:hypothetical protein